MQYLRALQARALLVFYAWDHAILATLTLGNCRPYEMVSSALWSLELDGKLWGRALRPVVDFALRPLGANHCAESYSWQIKIYKKPI